MRYITRTKFKDEQLDLRFHMNNLGPIKEAKISVNNLTIITGENNVGKSLTPEYLNMVIKDRIESGDYLLDDNNPQEVSILYARCQDSYGY